MSDELMKQLLSRLDAVGAKLGAAGNVLWAAAIRQQYIDGAFSLLGAVLLCIIGVVVIKAGAKVARKYKDEEYLSFGLFIGAIVFCVMLALLYSGVSNIANPQFGAMQSLLSAVKQ